MNTEELNHRPTRDPDGRHGSMVFSARWLRLMDSFKETLDSFNPLPPEIECILDSYPYEITQRAASVAANFIAWLGTNCGRAYLSEAERLTKWMFAPSAHAAQWALENHRHRAKDNGLRIAEVLAPDGKPDQKDLEVVEHVAWWLGSTEGQAFVCECQQFAKWDFHDEICHRFSIFSYTGVNTVMDELSQVAEQDATQ